MSPCNFVTTGKASIYRDIPRAPAALVAKLHGLSVADIHDALPLTMRNAALMGPPMRPITCGLRTSGLAVTAHCAPGDSLMSHCALYLARPGDVLVIVNGGVPCGAVWGGNVAFDAKTLGVAGAIVDAPVRDVAFIREIQFPVWSSSVSASRSEKHGRGYVNMPVSCAGCVVNPGDLVLADDDGVIVFPPALIEEVVERSSLKTRDEMGVRARIQGGERLFDTQKFGGLLKANGIDIAEGHWLERPRDRS